MIYMHCEPTYFRCDKCSRLYCHTISRRHIFGKSILYILMSWNVYKICSLQYIVVIFVLIRETCGSANIIDRENLLVFSTYPLCNSYRYRNVMTVFFFDNIGLFYTALTNRQHTAYVCVWRSRCYYSSRS